MFTDEDPLLDNVDEGVEGAVEGRQEVGETTHLGCNIGVKWKYNFPLNPRVRRLVSHNFLKGLGSYTSIAPTGVRGATLGLGATMYGPSKSFLYIFKSILFSYFYTYCPSKSVPHTSIRTLILLLLLRKRQSNSPIQSGHSKSDKFFPF